MEQKEIIKRLNEGIDSHFKKNKGAWRVDFPQNASGAIVVLRQMHACGNRIMPVFVALYVLRKEPLIEYVHYADASTVYTRTTLRRAGYKI